MRPEVLLSAFHAAGDLTSTSVNFPCDQKTFRPSKFQISMQPGDLLSTSDIFQSCQQIFRHLHSPYCGTRRLSVNVPFGWETFRQLVLPPEVIPLAFVKFPCVQKIFKQLCVRMGYYSVNFHQLSVRTEDFTSTSVNFPCGWKTFVNFCQLYLRPGDLTSTSINFLCSRGTTVNSVNFLCDRETRKRSSTFRAAVGHSINLGQLSLCPSTFPCGRETFRHLLSTFRAS